MSQLAQTVGRLESQGKLPSQTEANPRENVSAITLWSGTVIEPIPRKAAAASNEKEGEEKLKPEEDQESDAKEKEERKERSKKEERVDAQERKQGVWQVFDRHGVVIDVFIPKKVAADGSRFGFVCMQSKEDADRVIERFDGFWLYGYKVRVMMAARVGQRSFWRKKRGRSSSHQSKLSASEGVIDEENMEILRFCAVGFYRKPYLLLDLAREFRYACLEGFTVMRMAGSVVLLMFADTEKRRSVIENGCLDPWLENLTDWSSEFRLPNRRVWLSVLGVPIHAWSTETFKNIVGLWGELVQVDVETLVPSTFERCRFQVEIDWNQQINKSIELQIHDQNFLIRVVEFEEYIHTKSECCCEADEDSSKTERTVQESLHSAKVFNDGSNPAEVVVEDTVVPESLEVISSDQLQRMWEGNVRDDMRVGEFVSSPRDWSNDEVAGCIARLDTTVPFVDVVQEVVLSENRDASFFLGEGQVQSPVVSGGRGMSGPRSERIRVNKATTMNIYGHQKWVRQLSDISLSFLSPTARIEAERKLNKKGRGRTKQKPEAVANASLSDSDFANRNRGILKEAHETVVRKIDSIRRNFLWGGSSDRRKMSRVSWSLACRPKRFGGLGVVDLRVRNLALLAKWSWRYAIGHNSLWKSLIFAKYGVLGHHTYKTSCSGIIKFYVPPEIHVQEPKTGGRVKTAYIGFLD
ncbi:hypothetical protein GQ457_12G019510 [Hibiscus cannabinus]